MTTIWVLVIIFTATPGAFVHEVPTASRQACETAVLDYIRDPNERYGYANKGRWDSSRLSAICVEKAAPAGPAS